MPVTEPPASEAADVVTMLSIALFGAFNPMIVQPAWCEHEKVISEDERAVVEELATSPERFSDDELDVLGDSGLSIAPASKSTVARVVATAALQELLMLSDALTLAETAKRLDRTEDEVLEGIGSRAIFGVRHADDWFMPYFQFDSNGLVSGVSEVLQSLPVDMRPLAIWSFFVDPDVDLNEIRPISPIDWLKAGRDIAPILRLAEAALTA